MAELVLCKQVFVFLSLSSKTNARARQDLYNVKEVVPLLSTGATAVNTKRKFLFCAPFMYGIKHNRFKMITNLLRKVQEKRQRDNGGGLEAIKYIWKCEWRILFARVLCFLLLLFFLATSRSACLNCCLHCPHDFPWWLKVLLCFVVSVSSH